MSLLCTVQEKYVTICRETVIGVTNLTWLFYDMIWYDMTYYIYMKSNALMLLTLLQNINSQYNALTSQHPKTLKNLTADA